MHYLGYHLLHKLWRNPKANMVVLENDFGQLIDRNYYPLKLGIDTTSKGETEEGFEQQTVSGWNVHESVYLLW
jgi:hypothetical protein